MPGPNDGVALVNFFSFEIDGQPIDLVHQVSGLKWSNEPVTFKATNKKGASIQKIAPGMWVRPAELTFKTFEIDTKLPAWFEKALSAGAKGMSKGAIVLYDEQLKAMGKYNLTNVWPSKLSWSTLTAGSSTPMELEVTIQVDAIDFQK